MKNYSICFSTLYEKYVAWTWQELLFGVKNNIIAIEDILNYTDDIYCEFDYPEEISGLVSYMPKEDEAKTWIMKH